MFTIILLVYNKKDRILNCLEGLRLQTSHDFRLIISDNLSNDGSYELISSAASQLKCQVKQKRRAVHCDADEHLLSNLDEVSDGYFMILDAEDVLSPNFVEYVNAHITNNPEEIFYPQHYELASDGFSRPLRAPGLVSTLPLEMRLPYLASITNEAGIGYLFYAIGFHVKLKALYRRVISLPRFSGISFGTEDMVIGLLICQSTLRIGFLPSVQLYHYGRYQGRARSALSNSAIEDIYGGTPQSMYAAFDEYHKHIETDTISLMHARQIIGLRLSLSEAQRRYVDHVSRKPILDIGTTQQNSQMR
jgi:glycosyltransferase involved in cell wall biosynthesis